MHAATNDEYQDSASTGSLVSARRCWLDLGVTGALPHLQQFSFGFACPSRRMALGLMDFLGYAPYAGFVTAGDGSGAWRVAGTTRPRVHSLPSLEHLFMDLRRAAARYDSRLVTLDLLPAWAGWITGA
jgi:hypothetical protein